MQRNAERYRGRHASMKLTEVMVLSFCVTTSRRLDNCWPVSASRSAFNFSSLSTAAVYNHDQLITHSAHGYHCSDVLSPCHMTRPTQPPTLMAITAVTCCLQDNSLTSHANFTQTLREQLHRCSSRETSSSPTCHFQPWAGCQPITWPGQLSLLPSAAWEASINHNHNNHNHKIGV